MPTGTGEEVKEYLTTETEDLKYIADYTGLSFNNCLELDCYTYKLLLRDAFIYRMKQTEDGREYLENCYMLYQTEPDRNKLKQRFGGGKE